MAALQNFPDFDSKMQYFSNNEYYIINTKEQFDSWFNIYNQDNKYGNRINYIYRGMTDARYRLYTSAQRQWIANDMQEWVGAGYLGYVSELLSEAKKNVLLKRVFDIYGYSDEEREIPLLSILQHYGAPTPLMDWTYNINVALFFATQNIKTGLGTGTIDKYFSVYFVNKSRYRDVFLNVFAAGKRKHPSLNQIREGPRSTDKNLIYYISDFEIATYKKSASAKFEVNERDPQTTIYNQHIIPQEGLFILNPMPDRPVDDFFRSTRSNIDGELLGQPFACFNIKKDLADYVRRRIKNRAQIDESFIYPDLRNEAKAIHEQTLYNLAP